MKRHVLSCLYLTILSSMFSLPLVAYAQQAAPKPPVLEKLEEGEAPAVTIKSQDKSKKITERREQGKVKEVQVQSGGSSYVVKANDQPGSIQPGEGQSTATRVPQWKIMEFDLGGKKDKKDAKEGDAPPAPK